MSDEIDLGDFAVTSSDPSDDCLIIIKGGGSGGGGGGVGPSPLPINTTDFLTNHLNLNNILNHDDILPSPSTICSNLIDTKKRKPLSNNFESEPIKKKHSTISTSTSTSTTSPSPFNQNTSAKSNSYGQLLDFSLTNSVNNINPSPPLPPMNNYSTFNNGRRIQSYGFAFTDSYNKVTDNNQIHDGFASELYKNTAIPLEGSSWVNHYYNNSDLVLSSGDLRQIHYELNGRDFTGISDKLNTGSKSDSSQGKSINNLTKSFSVERLSKASSVSTASTAITGRTPPEINKSQSTDNTPNTLKSNPINKTATSTLNEIANFNGKVPAKTTSVELFNRQVELCNKRPILKCQHVLRVSFCDPEVRDYFWRKPCVKGHITLFALHTTLQTCMGWSDSQPHCFILPNGLQIGKVSKNQPVFNERKLTVSQVLPTTKFWLIYEYGDRLPLLITQPFIAASDSLPPSRLCGGKGPSPPEHGLAGQSLSHYLQYTMQPNIPPFNVDTINEALLAGKSIKLLSGMRKSMSEEESKEFQLTQMCLEPTESYEEGVLHKARKKK